MTRTPTLMLLLLGGCVMRSTLGELDDGSNSGDGTEDSATDGDSAEGGLSDTGDDMGDDTGEGSEIPSSDGWSVPEQCAAVAAESAYCLTVAYDGFYLLGVDSGAACNIGPGVGDPENGGSLYEPSFAWDGMSIVTCGTERDDFTLARYHLLTGQRQSSTVQCRAVTDWGARILVARFDQLALGALAVHDDFDDILAGMPGEELGFQLNGSRMVTDGETLWDAWHATDTLWRHTMDGEPLSDLPLDGHDGWVNGMFVMDGVLMLLTHGNDDDIPHAEQIRRFDAQTGEFLGRQLLDDLPSPQGLRCRRGT